MSFALTGGLSGRAQQPEDREMNETTTQSPDALAQRLCNLVIVAPAGQPQH
jgi:hypothetical protein